jgi:hypothetical protein
MWRRDGLTSLKRYTRRTILLRGVLDALLNIVCQRNNRPADEAIRHQSPPSPAKVHPMGGRANTGGPPVPHPRGMIRDFMTMSTYVAGVGSRRPLMGRESTHGKMLLIHQVARGETRGRALRNISKTATNPVRKAGRKGRETRAPSGTRSCLLQPGSPTRFSHRRNLWSPVGRTVVNKREYTVYAVSAAGKGWRLRSRLGLFGASSCARCKHLFDSPMWCPL